MNVLKKDLQIDIVRGHEGLKLHLKKKKNFASFLWKSAQIYMVEWIGRNFDVFPGFQKIPCYA